MPSARSKGGGTMAEAMGVNTASDEGGRSSWWRRCWPALSGFLYAHSPARREPDRRSGSIYGIEYLFMAVVGGVGHVWGAVLRRGHPDHPQGRAAGAAAEAARLPRAISRSLFFGVLMVLLLQLRERRHSGRSLQPALSLPSAGPRGDGAGRRPAAAGAPEARRPGELILDGAGRASSSAGWWR